MAQKRTSKDTSVNILNTIYRIFVEEKGYTGLSILDYGCGKYDTNKNYAIEHGFKWIGCDKYNKSQKHNDKVMQYVKANPVDIIVCNNVLNVIDDDEAMLECINTVLELKAPHTDVYFTIYLGDRSGIGKETTKGWQRNQRTKYYVDIIKTLVNNNQQVKSKNNIIKISGKEVN